MTENATLSFIRKIDASPTQVFKALTEADHRCVWGAPDQDSIVVIENQPKPIPGGRELSHVGPAENPYVDVATDWIILEPAVRVVYAETLSAEGEAFAVSLAAFELSEDGSGTSLQVSVQCLSFDGAEALGEVEGGWSHAIDALSAYVGNAHATA